jgi:hypothetical protein
MSIHSELVAAGLRDPDDLTGLIPDSYVCIDCGMDTWPGHKTRAEVEQSIRADRVAGKKWRGTTMTFTNETEVYYVHPHVWKASGVDFWSGCLCIGCLENRIGRRLLIAEHASGFNNPNLPGTKRRLERLLGTEVTEYSDEKPEMPEPSKLELALQTALGKRWEAA